MLRALVILWCAAVLWLSGGAEWPEYRIPLAFIGVAPAIWWWNSRPQ